jgi:type II secretory pathway pseudopilin PulG
MMTVVAIVGLLASIAVPSMIRARSGAQRNACLNNLRQIDSGKQQWAVEKTKAPLTLLSSQMCNRMSKPCPFVSLADSVQSLPTPTTF